MANFISLAMSDTMFSEGIFSKKSLTADQARDFLHSNNVVSAANPSHTATFNALSRKFGIDLPIPAVAPLVSLEPGDSLLIFQAKLPRLAEGEVHSQETVENAEFKFSIWRVQ